MTGEGWHVAGPAEVTRPRPLVGRLLQRLAARLERWSTVTVIDDHGETCLLLEEGEIKTLTPDEFDAAVATYEERWAGSTELLEPISDWRAHTYLQLNDEIRQELEAKRRRRG